MKFLLVLLNVNKLHNKTQKGNFPSLTFRAKYIVAMREEEKKANIIRAEGEAEAARLVAEAVGKAGGGIGD